MSLSRHRPTTPITTSKYYVPFVHIVLKNRVYDSVIENVWIMLYTKWTKHGEEDEPSISAPKPVNATTEFVDDMDFAYIPTDGPATVEMVNATKDNFDVDDLVKFQELLLDARGKLITKMLDKKMLPAGNKMVEKTYQAKKVMRLMGSGYKKIHVCINTKLAFLLKDDKDLLRVDLWDIKMEGLYVMMLPQKKLNHRAIVLWTINDYPALGTLCGCPYSGFKGCVVCGKDTNCVRLSALSKQSYVGHRRYLPYNHPFRKQKKAFNGQQEFLQALIPMTGEQIYNEVKHIENKWGKGKRTNNNASENQEDTRGRGGKIQKQKRNTTEEEGSSSQVNGQNSVYWKKFNICKEIILQELDKMQAELVVTLCLLEKFFPPSFFDIMIHLTVHLTREVKLCGPICFWWMYPFERCMKVIKGHVRNRNKLEGCIAEETITEETIEFFSEYHKSMETIGIPPDKHETDENEEGKPLSAVRLVLRHIDLPYPKEVATTDKQLLMVVYQENMVLEYTVQANSSFQMGDWVNHKSGGVKRDKLGYTLVDLNNLGHTVDPLDKKLSIVFKTPPKNYKDTYDEVDEEFSTVIHHRNDNVLPLVDRHDLANESRDDYYRKDCGGVVIRKSK
ncbi:putative reverse transcriptase domain-containing protein [Tanacetum coccineum]